MTVISCVQLPSRVFLLGDTLLSAPGPAKPVYLPFVGSKSHSPSKSLPLYVPSGLHQKIGIMNDHVAVAWSGAFHVAWAAIKSLRERVVTPDNAIHHLDVILSEFSTDERQSVTLFLVCLKEVDHATGRISLYFRGADGTTHYQLNVGRIWASGSGAEKFGDALVSMLMQEQNYRFFVEDAKYSSSWMPLMTSIAHANAGEFFRGRVAEEMYGAAYELVMGDTRRSSMAFSKVDKVAYGFWRVQRDSDGIHFDLQRDFVCQWYNEECLYVLRDSFVPYEGQQSFLTCIPPPWSASSPRLVDLHAISFHSRWVIHTLLFQDHNEGIVASAVYITPSSICSVSNWRCFHI